jgi:hypothetical protein
VEWSYEGALISRTASGDTGPNRVIERPKVVYNKQTGKYVLWAHIDSANYGEAKIGVAIGDSVCGKYTYLRSERPLGFESRDSGVFVDDDGKGYLLTEDVRLSHLIVRIHISNKNSAATAYASTHFPMTISMLLGMSTSGKRNTSPQPSSNMKVFTSCSPHSLPDGTQMTTTTAHQHRSQVHGLPGKSLQTLDQIRTLLKQPLYCLSGMDTCTWAIDGKVRI